MKLKSLEEFLNESYSGSMSSLIVKMKNEMKSAQVIYSHLCSLGVDPIRVQEEMRKHGPYAIEFSSEYKINSDKHKNPDGFPGPSGRMSGVNESEVNEASRFKGKEIYPDWVTPKDIKGIIRNVKDLTVGAQYALLDLGMDAWQAEYEYKGKVGSKHLFTSTAQGDSGSDLEYTDKELKDAVSSVEVALMESKMNEEGDLEDQLDDLEDDLEKTSDDIEDSTDKKPEDKESDEVDTEDKEDALKSAVSDIEKLDKIKKILAESKENETDEDSE